MAIVNNRLGQDAHTSRLPVNNKTLYWGIAAAAVVILLLFTFASDRNSNATYRSDGGPSTLSNSHPSDIGNSSIGDSNKPATPGTTAPLNSQPMDSNQDNGSNLNSTSDNNRGETSEPGTSRSTQVPSGAAER